jgi:hypothetical protein
MDLAVAHLKRFANAASAEKNLAMGGGSGCGLSGNLRHLGYLEFLTKRLNDYHGDTENTEKKKKKI